MKRILVTGGRFYNNKPRVWAELDKLRIKHGKLHVIEGGATGADQAAREWVDFEQAWHGESMASKGSTEFVDQKELKRYGNHAFNMRNQRMLNRYEPELVLAFHGGRGTADMVHRARLKGIPVMEIDP